MTSRERIQAILALEIPDRMGLHEHIWAETIPDYWINEGYPEGTDPTGYFGYDIVQAGGWWDVAPFPGKDETVEETDEWRTSVNSFGSTLKHWKNKSGTPEHIDFDCISPRIWGEKYKPRVDHFDPARVDVEALREAYEEAMSGERFVCYGNLMQLEIMRKMLGDVTMLQSLLLEPDWIRDICGTYADLYVETYDYIFREVGKPDGMFMYEDLGFRNGPFMSEQTYREVLMPYHRQVFDFFHRNGLPVIFHACGDVRKLVAAASEAGIDCLQPMEAKSGCNVLELSRQFEGELSFMGNIDVKKLNTNDREVIRQEVVPKLDALRERRVPYVFHSDHSIPPDVRLSSYRYALELLQEHGLYE
jgi:uroporphyrinogen decarboxylase